MPPRAGVGGLEPAALHGRPGNSNMQDKQPHRTRGKVTKKQREAQEICLTSWEPVKGKLRQE